MINISWILVKSRENFIFLFLDFHRWPIWCSFVQHFPRRARRPNWHWHRRDPVRVHPAVNHASLLAGEATMPQVRLSVERRHHAKHVQPQEGKILRGSYFSHKLRTSQANKLSGCVFCGYIFYTFPPKVLRSMKF